MPAPDTVPAGRTPLLALQAGDREAVLRLVYAASGTASGDTTVTSRGPVNSLIRRHCLLLGSNGLDGMLMPPGLEPVGSQPGLRTTMIPPAASP